MRIALFCHKFWPAIGGLCTYTGRLAEYLTERGHDVRVFTTKSPPDTAACEQASPRLRIRRFNTALTNHPPYYFTPQLMRPALLREVREADVVHSVGYYFFGSVFGRAAAKLSRLPHVSTPVYTLNPSNWQRHAFDAVAGRHLVRTSAHVIPQSAYELGLMRSAHFTIGAHTLVPFGVDSSLFRETYAVDDLRMRHAIAANDRVLLFVGKVMSPKGAFDALEMVATLRSRGHRLRLVMLGDVHGRERTLFSSRIQELELTSNVTLVGAVTDRREICRYYQLADAVIFPSQYEQFGIVAIEAAASGRPLLGTPVGIMQTFVPQYEVGLLHPFGDIDRFAQNVIDVLDTPRYRENAARHRAEVLERYDWRDIAERTEAIYERTVRERR